MIMNWMYASIFSFSIQSPVLDVTAKISSPVKLSLSKDVYEQILQTTDNLTYDRESEPSAATFVPQSPDIPINIQYTHTQSTQSIPHEEKAGE